MRKIITMRKFYHLITVSIFCVAGISHADVNIKIVGSYNGECTSYARSQVRSLPPNLWTYQDKKNIRNSNSCKAGSVAIIDAGTKYGHVAVVESCDSSGKTQGIKIREANWKNGKITQREARSKKISRAQSELRIYGYFRP